MPSPLFRKKSIAQIQADAATGMSDAHGSAGGLHRVLTVRDLTFFGIAAIIGAGSFSSMGEACLKGGPAVVILFVMCAVACGFAALCYAEFAARIPVSGSAYTYAYASFGELFAWIIGWALLMEYSIGNIYVAFSWSDYFSNLLEGLGLRLPPWLTCSYHEARVSAEAGTTGEGATAWATAPVLGGLRIILDVPAVLINLLITWLVYRGVRESRNASNAMVVLKLAVVALVIGVGIFYVDIDRWTPFMPNGFGGVMAGVSAVFFAFIGFDAVSTLAEESRNPQRDLPRGMMYSLAICTGVYILLALVLTGMVSYQALGVGDPLAEVFKLRGVRWMLFFVSIAAVVAMTSVMLVFQMGQPRIWMSMSRDGLLPARFSSIHPRYKTPGFSTIVTGLVVGLPLLFTDKKFVLDFTSIGTLFAFILVCGGVLLLPRRPATGGGFRLPYINARYIAPALFLSGIAIASILMHDYWRGLFTITADTAATAVPMIIYLVLCAALAVASFAKNLSLIPVLGLASCGYLLTGMTPQNWAWFFAWFLLGLLVYFLYGYRRSRLRNNTDAIA